MRYLRYISVAILTFALGFSLSSILRASSSMNVEMQSVAELRNDDLHQLFEAAYMSKDEDLRDEVLGRLQCASEDGSLKRDMYRGDNFVLCSEFVPDYLLSNYGGAHNRWSFDFKSVPPFQASQYYYDIIKTHGDWSRKNMAFVHSVADPKAAQLYIKHRLARE